jgi:hypothetical protein
MRVRVPVPLCCILAVAQCLQAQDAGTGAKSTATSTLGSVVKIDPKSRALEVKTDGGTEVTVLLQPNAMFRRVTPGETDLRNAAAITLGDVSVGDRVLARGLAADSTVSATLLVVMSQGDIAEKQAAERSDWEKRGMTGLVTRIAADSVIVSVRTLAGSALVTITPAAGASIRRYAPDSVRFSDAKASSLGEIKPGDQVRARGEKSADGTRLAAEEIVFGTFRTFAGVVQSLDAESGEMRVRDLDTKKTVTVKVNPDAILHKLAAAAAQAIAVRVHPELAANGKGGPAPAGDLQQIVDRSPAVTLADLKNGDAVVISSTVGAVEDRVTAITLVAGVEPILTKPGTRQMSLGSWSLDVGGGIGAQ